MKRMLVLGLLLAATQAPAAEFRWLNSWDRNSPQVPLLAEPYIKAVEAATQGRVKFVASGPETVPAFEQLQPVASGAFQFLSFDARLVDEARTALDRGLRGCLGADEVDHTADVAAARGAGANFNLNVNLDAGAVKAP